MKVSIQASFQTLDIPVKKVSETIVFNFIRVNFKEFLRELTNYEINGNEEVKFEIGDKNFTLIDNCSPPECPYTQSKMLTLKFDQLLVKCSLNVSYWNSSTISSSTFSYNIYCDTDVVYKMNYDPERGRLFLESKISSYNSLLDDARFIRKGLLKYQ